MVFSAECWGPDIFGSDAANWAKQSQSCSYSLSSPFSKRKWVDLNYARRSLGRLFQCGPTARDHSPKWVMEGRWVKLFNASMVARIVCPLVLHYCALAKFIFCRFEMVREIDKFIVGTRFKMSKLALLDAPSSLILPASLVEVSHSNTGVTVLFDGAKRPTACTGIYHPDFAVTYRLPARASVVAPGGFHRPPSLLLKCPKFAGFVPGKTTDVALAIIYSGDWSLFIFCAALFDPRKRCVLAALCSCSRLRSTSVEPRKRAGGR
jgi:hypothetical protein